MEPVGAEALTTHPVQAWHRLVQAQDARALDTLLAEDVVFHSPVVHTPHRGKALARLYLSAALQVFSAPGFRYVREVVGERDAVLEFETEIDGVLVNGVDLLRWNEDGRIVDFKVMLRPLKALDAVRQRMAALLPGPRAVRASIGTVALVVPDYDEALRYYTEVLRFRVVEDRQITPEKRWLVVAPQGGGARLLLARAATPEQHARIGDQTGGRVFLFLEVDDFDNAYAHLQAQGVQFTEAPRREEYGTVVVFLDRYGNKWDLIGRGGA